MEERHGWVRNVNVTGVSKARRRRRASVAVARAGKEGKARERFAFTQMRPIPLT